MAATAGIVQIICARFRALLSRAPDTKTALAFLACLPLAAILVVQLQILGSLRNLNRIAERGVSTPVDVRVVNGAGGLRGLSSRADREAIPVRVVNQVEVSVDNPFEVDGAGWTRPKSGLTEEQMLRIDASLAKSARSRLGDSTGK